MRKIIIFLMFSHMVWATESREESYHSTQPSVNSISHIIEKSDEFETHLSPQCLNISSVYIQGNTIFSNDNLPRIIKKLNECITIEHVNKLMRDIKNKYISNGYIMVAVDTLPLNKKRELGISIIEGAVERIDGTDNRTNPHFLFPGVQGKPLRLSEIDQAIDQANRLQSNQVTLNLLPGSEQGMSIINVNNIDAKPWLLSTSVDNYGYKNVDEWQGKTSLTWDSPFKLSDLVTVNFNRTLENSKNRYKYHYTLFYSVPYGAYTFSTTLNKSQSRRYEKLKYQTIMLSNNNERYRIENKYTFHRNSQQINSASANIEHKKINAFINEAKLNINSYQNTVLELGVNHYRKIPNGGINAYLSIEKGIPWLDANRADKQNNRFLPRSDFIKNSIMLSLYRNFRLADSDYQWNSVLAGQYSHRILPGYEQLNLTERGAVRGFSRSGLTGDNGWYSRNTISRYLFIKEMVLIPRLGADAGRALQRKNKEGWRSHAGISTGVSLHYKNALFDLESSRGWHLSEKYHKKEPLQFLFRASYTF
ncbi:ShlB/FhaC/HecB family hemolysin secretion/activation protein [Yersinia ruckeri]|uniref:ShlB/FhaC/HecB family hemolysin secretion/activation protein n=1 Tax=Yersinia ruckeri TaxID=29486 RepID=UPI0005380B10|nr:ShlB/FhaC/HecB family hemolysin secretion/activation protein [Yersinia ruckeri]AUQ43264.1 hemolysin activation protein [Yersinia ruckeri]WMS04949.1 ShlB/FhaC/HecB family hemolysin secretion/activation protein [Yersinia ruckeri]